MFLANCYGLAVAGNKSATQPPLPPAGVRRRMERNRQKLVGRDKGSLTETANKGNRNNNDTDKENTQQKPHSPESRSQRCALCTPTAQVPPTGMTAHGVEYSARFGQVGSARPAVSLPRFR